MPSRPIRTLIVDDHPAMRAGVATVLDDEPDIVVAGSASGERQLWPLLDALRPAVVLMDFSLEGENGVILCHRLKRRPRPPAVVLYSGFAGREFIAPAMLAGADALVSKRAAAPVVCRAIRDVAAAGFVAPPMPSDERERLGARLGEEDRSLAALVLSRHSPEAIASATGLTEDQVVAATEDLLRRLLG